MLLLSPVTVVAPPTGPRVADTTEVPGATERPLPAASTVTAEGDDDAHVTVDVTSDREVPSENTPVAVNRTATPTPTVGSIGVTSIDRSVAAVIPRTAAPETAPTRAVTVVMPGDTPVATPTAVTVAKATLPVVHRALAVTS